MHKYTNDQFKAILLLGAWEFEQHVEHVDSNVFPQDTFNDGGESINTHYGYATITARCGDIEITYQEGYRYDAFMPDTFVASEDLWETKGFVIVDEFGDEEDFDYHEACELPSEFSDIRYQDENLYEYNETTDIDTDEKSDMTEKTTLEIDNQPNLRFTGERIASATSYHYSDRNDRWCELDLYKTAGGKYVCHQTGATRWQGEVYRYSGAVCDSTDDVVEFFGHGSLSKELYAEAGIDIAQDID